MAVASRFTRVNGAEVVPAKFGLLDSETLVTTEDEKWLSGVWIDSLSCAADVRIVDECDSDLKSEITSAGDRYAEAIPFWIEAEYQCSTFGFTEGEYYERALRGLELCKGKAVEHELWTGEISQADLDVDVLGNGNPNRYLASVNAINVGPTGSAVRPAEGLALLEKALGDCGCGTRGYVHATRDVASSLRKYVKPQGKHLETNLGTILVAGTGYTGSGPDGDLPGGSLRWMYATGQVSVGLGKPATQPTTLSEAIDRATNTVNVKAHQPAFVTWEGCCHYAVLVDLSLEY